MPGNKKGTPKCPRYVAITALIGLRGCQTLPDFISNRDPDEEVPLTRTSVTSNQYIAPIPFQAISTSNLVQNPEGFRIQ